MMITGRKGRRQVTYEREKFFGKKNKNTEVVSIRGGNYISQSSQAIYMDNCNNLTIYDGYFEGPTYWLSKGTITTFEIKGGTFVPSQDATTSPSCFATGTLITLADGTQKPIEQLDANDRILVWNFFTGNYDEQNIALLVDHGTEEHTVISLTFSDGSVLRLIGDHGLFDYDANRFVYLTAENADDYVGHRFVKANGNAIATVELTDVSVDVETIGAYSITSAITSDAFAAGLLTMAPPEEFYNWIEMSDGMQYDIEALEADIATYGTYDYDVFADYVTYEQYLAFNGAYLKIPVEKGIFSFEYILQLINLYI